MGEVGDGIALDRFSFESESVVENFDGHVERSVPGYHDAQDCIAALARHFAQPDTTILDLGCATGTTVARLFSDGWALPQGSTITLCDTSLKMLKVASARLRDAAPTLSYDDVEVDLCDAADCLDKNEGECSVVIAAFTLQFINPGLRADFFRLLYKSLVRYGTALIFEKLYCSSPRLSEAMRQAHHDIKAQQGHSREEIAQKDASLRGVMFPVQEKHFIQDAEYTGFVVTPVWRSLSFAGYALQRGQDV